MAKRKRGYPLKYWLRQKLRRFRGRRHRARLQNTTIIAITGSCGKTSATRFLGQILNDHARCVVGAEDNNENSMLRTLHDTPPGIGFLVQEVSGHEPGHLQLILSTLQHHIGIVTTVGLDHYTNYRNREAVAAEKSTVIRMLPDDGCAILNADDPYVAAMANCTKARIIRYGRCESADLRASDIRCTWPDRLSVTLNYRNQSARLETQMFGDLLLPSLLAAIAGGLACGLTLNDCTNSLQGVSPLPMRMSIHPSAKGAWFISDLIKAPNWSIKPCLEQFKDAQATRKTVVIGGISDIPGSDTKKYTLAAKAALAIFDRVIFTGIKSARVAKLKPEQTQGRLLRMESIQEAAEVLRADTLPGELIYLKSNRSEHLERLILHENQPLQCWINRCNKLVDCGKCPESGLCETAPDA